MHFDNFNLHCVISIHALLAESDHNVYRDSASSQQFLSTLSLRRATRGAISCYLDNIISIHALLAESDHAPSRHPCPRSNFYPRSPCGERHMIHPRSCNAKPNFYPRSPCGERLGGFVAGSCRLVIFLSTLSLRRATYLATR